MITGWGRLGAAAFACVSLGAGQALAQEQESPPAQQDAASNVTSYKPDFFSQFRPNTAMDMVGRIPGFSFDGGSGARGFSGTGGNVLIDGERPPSRGDSLGAIIARIPASGVERIDVIRGGAEGIDMQGKPIVANVIRKKDTGLTGYLAAGVSINDVGDVSPNTTLSVRNQSDGQLLEGSLAAARSDGTGENIYVRRSPTDVVLRQGRSDSDYKFARLEATGAWETTWLGGKLRLNGLINNVHQERASVGAILIPGGLQLNSGEQDTTAGEAGARYSRNFEGGYSLEVVGFQSLRSSDSKGLFDSSGIAGQADFTSGNANKSESGESIARATLRFPPIGEWSFETGGEGVFNYSTRNASFSFDGVPVALGGNRNRVEELRGDGFVTATWAPSSNLNVETGARFEWSRISATSDAGDSEKSLTYVKPRVNVSWTPETGTQWGLRVERTVDQLDFGSFASSAEFEKQIFGVGNPDAEPEKTWEAELRYERQFGGQNSIVVSFNHKYVEDVLGRAILVVPGTPPDPDQVFEITRNEGTGTVDQLNLNSTFELDSIGMPGGIFVFGGTLISSEIPDLVTGERHENSYTNPWSWNVSLQQTLDNGAFRWAVFLEDDGDSYEWTPHYYSRFHGGMFVGANVTWKPWKNWSFGAGVNNILAEDGEARFDYFEAPRSVGAAYDYREININPNYRTMFVNMRMNF